MIENAISNSSIAGRPPNSDFLIGFWPGENWSFFFLIRKISKKIPADILITESNDPRSYRQDSSKLLNTGFKFLYNFIANLDWTSN